MEQTLALGEMEHGGHVEHCVPVNASQLLPVYIHISRFHTASKCLIAIHVCFMNDFILHTDI